MVIKPSRISGTSNSNKRSRNSGDVRDNTIFGEPLSISTSWITARKVSPFLYMSRGIMWSLGSDNSLPSSSRTMISRFHTLYTSPAIISPRLSLYFLNSSSFSNSMILLIRAWRAFRMLRLPKSSRNTCWIQSSPTA